MTEDTENDAHFAELQQRWHGWGSPVGLSFAIVSLGLFVSMLAWSLSLFVGG